MKKNLSWTIIGNVFNSLVKWIILIMFVRFLSAEDVGEYSLALAVSAPLFLFANLRLRNVYVVSNKNNYKELMIIRVLTIIFSLILILIIATLFMNEYFWVIFLVSLTKIAELISDLLYALPHKNERLDLIGKILFVKSFGVLIVVGVTLLLTHSLVISLLYYVIYLFLFILIEFRLCKNHLENEKVRFNLISTLLITTLPLGFVQFMGSVNVSSPKYMLEIFHSIEMVGVFTSVSYILVVANLIISSISQTYIVSIKKLINAHEYSKLKHLVYQKLGIFGFIIGIVGVVISMIFGELIIFITYGNNISNYTFILIILSFSITFTFFSWISDTVLMAFEAYRVQPIIGIVVFILSLPITLLLVKNYDILGATLSLLVINILQSLAKTLCSHIIIKKRERENETRILS